MTHTERGCFHCPLWQQLRVHPAPLLNALVSGSACTVRSWPSRIVPSAH